MSCYTFELTKSLTEKEFLVNNLTLLKAFPQVIWSIQTPICVCCYNVSTICSTRLTSGFCYIGHEFVAPYPLEIKIETYSMGNLVITDRNNKIILKVKPCDSSFHRQLLLLDANDRSIVKLREKNMSEHKRWNVFRGESKADSDMIFSTKKEHATVSKNICVNVYMANKINRKGDYDFRIKGNWTKRSCSVYMGDSSTTIAQTNPVQSLETMKVEKDKFMVTISPNVDYVFVVALIAIIDAMKNSDTKDVVVGGSLGDVIGAMISS